MIRRTHFGAAMLVVLLPSVLCSQSSLLPKPSKAAANLLLQLDASKSKYSVGESVTVRAILKNVSNERWTQVVLYHVITPEGWGGYVEPTAEMRFQIKDDHGRLLPFSGVQRPTANPPMALPEQFLPLEPGRIFGVEVSLSDSTFSYALKEPGSYTIKAVYLSNAAEWLERYFKRYPKEKRHLRFDPKNIFNGTVESNEVRIEINK